MIPKYAKIRETPDKTKATGNPDNKNAKVVKTKKIATYSIFILKMRVCFLQVQKYFVRE